jgi:hypothetical protein
MPCSDCKHYHKTDISQGECRRWIPQLVVMPAPQVGGFRSQPQIASMFPPTKAENWCGEYASTKVVEW